MKRKRLAELVREETETLQESSLPSSEKRLLPSSEPPLTPHEEKEHKKGQRLPRYLTYIRKECRLRLDQIESLSSLARKIKQSYKLPHRLTENDLIRVAVDLFLNDVQGSAEKAFDYLKSHLRGGVDDPN